MVSPPAKPAQRPALSREDKRFAWVVLVAAWMALTAVLLFRYYPHRSPTLPSATGGVYRAVGEVVPPISLRLGDGAVVRVAGIAPPALPSATERAAARLMELAPPGTEVYIEIEPSFSGDGTAQPAASVWLPPPASRRPLPFPYGESRLIGAVLVQEGMVRVDPDQPYMYHNEFLLLEDDARRHGRGIWAPQ
jgi:endonuclease YncB( thermonuclease family)